MAKSEVSGDDWTTCESKSYGSSELNPKESISNICYNKIKLENYQCGKTNFSENNKVDKIRFIKPPNLMFNTKIGVQKKKLDTCFKSKIITECDKIRKQKLESKKLETPDNFSFGYPVGITWGSINRCDLYKGNDDVYLGVAVVYIAFGYLYIIPEKLWTTKVLDNMLLDGKKLYDESKELKDINDINDIKNNFFIKNYNINIKISNKIIIGKLNTNNKKIINICKGLNIYFRIYKKCLFMCNNIILLIWKKFNFYYVYDSLGRNNKLKINDKDKQLLLCFRKLSNVYNFIVHMCNLDENSVYILYNITMKTLNKKQINKVKENFKINNYKIVNNNYAILLSNFNINNICFNETKNKQSLATCFISIIYSKIIPPSTWNSNIIDKIILIGDQFYSNFIQKNDNFLIDNIPIKFTIEKYIIEIIINKNLFHGKLNLIINYNNNDLNIALCKFFINNQYCLIQINNLTYAIWEYNNFYYLFNLYKNNNKTSIEIYNKLTNLCYKLYNNIMKITCYYNFIIHSIDIITIKIVNNNKINVIYDHKNCINNLLNDMNVINDSIDDIFLKRICAKCKEVNKHPEDNKDQVVYNLDSPNLSETQFIPPWYMIKNDIYDTHKNADNLQETLTHSEEKKLSEEEKALLDYENVIKELEKNNNDKGPGGAGGGATGNSGGGAGTGSGGGAGGAGTGSGANEGGTTGNNSGGSGIANGKGGAGGKNGTSTNGKQGDKTLNSDGTTSGDDSSGSRTVDNKGSDGGNDNEINNELLQSANNKNVGNNMKDCGNPFDTSFPGLSCKPFKMAVVGSATGSYKSIHKLLIAAFRKSDRCLIMTTWNQYIVFLLNEYYYFYDGCTCNIPGFRRLDLTKGTCGLCQIKDIDTVINKILAKKPLKQQNNSSSVEDERNTTDDSLISKKSDNNSSPCDNYKSYKNDNERKNGCNNKIKKTSDEENIKCTTENIFTGFKENIAVIKNNNKALACPKLVKAKNNCNEPLKKSNRQCLKSKDCSNICTCTNTVDCNNNQNNKKPMDLFREIIQNCI